MKSWRIDHPSLDDVRAVTDLLNDRAKALESPTRFSTQSIEEWWTSPQISLSADVRVARDREGQIVAVANVSPPTEPFVSAIGGAVLAPSVWSDEVLWNSLHSWVKERATEHVGMAPDGAQMTLFTEAIGQDDRRQAAIAQAGFSLARVFFRMAKDLGGEMETAPCPPGIDVQRMARADLPAVAAVHVEAFLDHWGHGTESPETFAEKWLETTEGLKTDVSFVALDGRKAVGYALCESHYRGDPDIGHINLLGVKRSHRGRGIATALLHAAFSEMKGMDHRRARLGVDADSPTGALRLYEKVGMEVIEQINRYEWVLRDGRDLLNRS